MANYNFDGEALLITPADMPVNGLLNITVQDLYSRWKDWTHLSDNAKYPPAFTVLGGDPITIDSSVTPYFFLQNNWQIKPYESTHIFELDGALVPESFQPAVRPTVGTYNVVVRSILPLQSVTTLVDGGIGLTYPDGIETGVTMQEALRVILAVLAGKSLITDLGGGDAQVIFRNPPDTKNRVTANLTGSERTSVTLDTT